MAVAAWLLVYPAALVMRRRPEDHGLHPDGMTDAQVATGLGAAAAADYANSLTRREALRTSALYMIVLAFGLSGIATGTVLIQTIPFMTDEGFSRGTAALMITAFSVPSALTKPAWGLLIERVNVRYLSAASFSAIGAGVLVMLMGATAGSLMLVMPGFMLFGVGTGGLIPLQEVIWASYFGRRYLGAVRSVAMPFALFLAAGGPLLVSVYFDVVGDYHGAYVVLSGFSVLGAVVILFVRRPEKPSAQPEAAAA